MFLRTHRKIYEFNFGLKGLILLNKNTDLMMTNDMRFFLYCGLISKQPDITFQEIDEIIEQCDLSKIDTNQKPISLFEVEELYTKAVGEIGITPTDFYTMTPAEMILYFQRCQEIRINKNFWTHKIGTLLMIFQNRFSCKKSKNFTVWNKIRHFDFLITLL